MPKVIHNGTPGETWTNDTGKVQYQLIVNWANSCGFCAQNDHAISSSWAIPFHRGCRCKQILVRPGAESQPFVDFREKIAELDHVQQTRVVGRSNLTLIEQGVVKWGDVVTSNRVRDFREVVARQKLSVKEMTKAGVSPRLANDAYATVHTPAHELAAKQRQDALGKLLAKGVEKDQLRRALAERLAARVGIGRGPSGAGTMPVTPTTPKPPPLVVVKPKPVPKPPSKPVLPPPPKPPVRKIARPKRQPVPMPISGGSPAAIQGAHLKALGVTEKAIVKSVPGAPILPGRPMGERIEAYRKAEGQAKLDEILKLGTEVERIMTESAELSMKLIDFQRKVGAAGLDASNPATKGNRDAFERLLDEGRAIRARLAEVKGNRHREVAKVLAVPKDQRVTFAANGYDQLTAVGLKERTKQAEEFLTQIVHAPGKPVAVDLFEIAPTGEQRAHQIGKFKAGGTERYSTVHLCNTTPTWTAVHELAHTIEHQLPEVHAATQAFLDYRCKGETPQKMKDLFPTAGYRDDEMVRKDKFDQYFDKTEAWYAGKKYTVENSEVLSMGLQELYANPNGFADKDPDFVLFLMGVLDGRLR